MMPDAERKACALRELDAVVYFGLNRREAFFYRLLRPTTVIDATGENGNVFCILATARDLLRQLDAG